MAQNGIKIRAIFEKGKPVMYLVRIGDGATIHVIPLPDVYEAMLQVACRCVDNYTAASLAQYVEDMFVTKAHTFASAVPVTTSTYYWFPAEKGGTVRALQVDDETYFCPTRQGLKEFLETVDDRPAVPLVMVWLNGFARPPQVCAA